MSKSFLGTVLLDAKINTADGIFFDKRKTLLGFRKMRQKKTAHHPVGDHLKALFDGGVFSEELAPDLKTSDLLCFPGYREKLEENRRTTDRSSGCVAGVGTVCGIPAVGAELSRYFMMGSMGSAEGEKLTLAIEEADRRKLPLIIFSASGGARMQEGMLSLMQMAKTSAAVQKLREHGGLYISVLTHPTTGGVSASYASLGDIILAEPGALIGFAGPRVIEQTIGEKLPKGFQRAEFQLEHGFVDKIVPRKDQREVIAQILRLHGYGAEDAPENAPDLAAGKQDILGGASETGDVLLPLFFDAVEVAHRTEPAFARRFGTGAALGKELLRMVRAALIDEIAEIHFHGSRKQTGQIRIAVSDRTRRLFQGDRFLISVFHVGDELGDRFVVSSLFGKFDALRRFAADDRKRGGKKIVVFRHGQQGMGEKLPLERADGEFRVFRNPILRGLHEAGDQAAGKDQNVQTGSLAGHRKRMRLIGKDNDKIPRRQRILLVFHGHPAFALNGDEQFKTPMKMRKPGDVPVQIGVGDLSAERIVRLMDHIAPHAAARCAEIVPL